MSAVSARATRIVFFLIALIIIYALLPVGDILTFFSYEFDPGIRRASFFTAVQKTFFLGLALILLWQLARLAEDFISNLLPITVRTKGDVRLPVDDSPFDVNRSRIADAQGNRPPTQKSWTRLKFLELLGFA